MEYFTVSGWDKYQHYKDRNPPWIKLHYELITSLDWVSMDDASRVLAVACMLIASRHDGRIPADAKYIQRVAYLNAPPDFKPLIDCGFLDAASVMLATCYQSARPETEEETKEETEQTPSVGQKPNGTKHHTQDACMLIAFLNEKTGKAFQPKTPNGKLTSTGQSVVNLLKSGYTAQDIKTVIARKVRDWQGDANMVTFLRPKTLFAKSNFENYKGECVV